MFFRLIPTPSQPISPTTQPPPLISTAPLTVAATAPAEDREVPVPRRESAPGDLTAAAVFFFSFVVFHFDRQSSPPSFQEDWRGRQGSVGPITSSFHVFSKEWEGQRRLPLWSHRTELLEEIIFKNLRWKMLYYVISKMKNVDWHRRDFYEACVALLKTHENSMIIF